jgi:hypothetical protein
MVCFVKRFVKFCSAETSDPGSRGFGSVIPANSALVFDVELVGLDAKGSRQEL